MSSFFIHDITIYHLSNDTATRIQFEGVYFRHNKKVNQIDKGFEKGSTGSITIPTTETLQINTDDLVIEGLITAEYNPRNLRANYQVFRVVSVDDNRKGGLPHYKIGVSE